MKVMMKSNRASIRDISTKDQTKLYDIPKDETFDWTVCPSDSDYFYKISYSLGIKNCILWLVADSFINKNDGDPIDVWIDRSGSGNHALQQTPSNQLTYHTNVINGHSSLRKTNDDQYMIIKNFPQHPDITFYSVIRTNTGADQGVFVLMRYSALSSPYNSYVLERSDVEETRTSISDSDQHPTVIYTDTDVFHVGGASRDSSVIESFVDGVWTNVKTNPGNIPYDTSNDTLYIMGSGGIYGGTDAIRGDIAELLIYDSSLSDTNRSKIETYLNNKYNIY